MEHHVREHVDDIYSSEFVRYHNADVDPRGPCIPRVRQCLPNADVTGLLSEALAEYLEVPFSILVRVTMLVHAPYMVFGLLVLAILDEERDRILQH